MRIRAGAVLVLVVFATACAGGHARHVATAVTTIPGWLTTTTVPTSVPTTSTTGVVDPSVVPAVIDRAYLDAVFIQLDRLNGDIVRLEVQTGRFPHQAAAILRALYGDPDYAAQLQIAGVAITQLQDVRNPPGNPKTTISRIISATPKCVFVQASIDYSGTAKNPPAVDPNGYVSLKPKAPGTDPQQLNPTSWSVATAEIIDSPASVSNPCAVS